MADTNIKYLKENNLYEAHKKFMRIAEGFGYSAAIEEADDEENQQDDMSGGAPMGQDATNDGAPMGGEQMPMGQDATNGEVPMGGEQMPMGQDATNDGAPMGGEQMPMGQDATNGEVPMGGEQMPMGQDAMASSSNGDEVIDVNDMVKAQEKTNDKVNSVGRDLGTVDKRIEKLLGALESMQGVIDKNNAEIASLKSEFEKRNPTQTERLNLRSLDSYPFNVRPDDYWREKGRNSNYSAYSDNDESPTNEYEITNDDVRDVNDDIANTFDIPEDSIQDFRKIFNT